MSRWRPCKRREFIRRLRGLGFKGPYRGRKHEFMLFNNHRLTIPSNNEYSVPQLKFMLDEVKYILGRMISLDEWRNLK